MNVLPRTQFGDPILRAKAKRVLLKEIGTKKIQVVIDQMFYTMMRADGVGLAAPQIGKSIQLSVIKIAPTKHRADPRHLSKTVVINPKIIRHSQTVNDDWEGCLSCPNLRALVPRYDSVVVQYYDETGEKQVVTCTDLHARVFQHEIDHLNGILYVDRIKDIKSIMTLQEYNKRVLKK